MLLPMYVDAQAQLAPYTTFVCRGALPRVLCASVGVLLLLFLSNFLSLVSLN